MAGTGRPCKLAAVLVWLGAAGSPLLLHLPDPHDPGGLGPHPPQLLRHHHPHPRPLLHPRQHCHIDCHRLRAGGGLRGPVASHGEVAVCLAGYWQAPASQEENRLAKIYSIEK